MVSENYLLGLTLLFAGLTLVISIIQGIINRSYQQDTKKMRLLLQKPSFALHLSSWSLSGGSHSLILTNHGNTAHNIKIDAIQDTTKEYFIPTMAKDNSIELYHVSKDIVIQEKTSVSFKIVSYDDLNQEHNQVLKISAKDFERETLYVKSPVNELIQELESVNRTLLSKGIKIKK